MMNNLFSIFDPSSSFASMSWIIMMAPLMLTKDFKMKKELLVGKTKKVLMGSISTEIKQLMSKKNKKMSTNLMVIAFLMMSMMNMLALLPFNLTPTAHASITLPISLTLWLSTLMYGLKTSFKNMVLHLTPLGTPTPLMNFMVIIETVSNIIRPITLSVRLTANMVAGHLLVSLLSNFSLSSKTNLVVSLFPMTALSMLELMVALVQAYVLTTLMTLYHNEA